MGHSAGGQWYCQTGKPQKAITVIKSKVAAASLTHEQIAKLAYQYWLKNQKASAQENWLKAEAKLVSKVK